MNFGKTLIICIILLLFNACQLPAAEQILKANSSEYNVGDLFLGFSKEGCAVVKNIGTESFLVDKVISKCSCLKSQIDTMEIASGTTAKLSFLCFAKNNEPYRHEIAIIPKDKEKYRPLIIPVVGNIKEDIAVKIGWNGEPMIDVMPGERIKLGYAYYKTAELIVKAFASNKNIIMQLGAPISVTSNKFQLKDPNVRYVPVLKDEKEDEKTIVICLALKNTPSIGKFYDIVEITFSDSSRLSMPIISRFIGNIYPEVFEINLDSLNQITKPKILKLFCKDIENVVSDMDIKWITNGPLADIITIDNLIVDNNASTFSVQLSVDNTKLSTLQSGFAYGRIKFLLRDQSNEYTTDMILYGYK